MTRALQGSVATATVALLAAGAVAVVVFSRPAQAGAAAPAAPHAKAVRTARPAQATAERYGAAVVVVTIGARRAHGFFVSSAGVLCTVLPGARAGDAVVVQTSGDGDAEGVVAVVDDDGLALVQVATDAGTTRAALGVAGDASVAGRWLVGLSRDERGVVRGALGDVVDADAARLRLLLPLPRGAPVLNEKNEVVAVAVAGHEAGIVPALPAARIVALARRLTAQTTTQATTQTTTQTTTHATTHATTGAPAATP
jgi:hypothetical protein